MSEPSLDPPLGAHTLWRHVVLCKLKDDENGTFPAKTSIFHYNNYYDQNCSMVINIDF